LFGIFFNIVAALYIFSCLMETQTLFETSQ
jgi:hypothetical protein